MPPRNPPRSFGLAWFTVALAIAYPGCSRETRTPAATGPTVRTVARGSGDPRSVRYAVAEDEHQTVRLTTRLGMTVQYGEEVLPAADMPATRTTLETDVTDVDGGFAHRFRIAGCNVVGDGTTPDRLAAIRADLDAQSPVGLVGRVTRAATGAIAAVDFEIPRGANPTVRHILGNLEQALHQLAVPFPSEPIAAGARWTISQDVEVNQMQLSQETEYRLDGIEADGTLTIGVTSTLLGSPQRLRLPNMPKTSSCELIEATANGEGSLRVRLDRPLPMAGRVTMRIQMRASIHSEDSPSEEIGGLVTLTIEVDS